MQNDIACENGCGVRCAVLVVPVGTWRVAHRGHDFPIFGLCGILLQLLQEIQSRMPVPTFLLAVMVSEASVEVPAPAVRRARRAKRGESVHVLSSGQKTNEFLVMRVTSAPLTVRDEYVSVV